MNRRRFLTALGLTGAAASLGMPSRASTTPGTPKRLILLSHGHGWVYDGWKMRPGGMPDDSEWEVDLNGLDASEFSTSLAPLYEHRNRMIAMDGLSLVTAELDIDGYRHEKGWVQAWTGGWAYFNGAELSSQEPSVDQIIAGEIARPDRLPSLELAIGDARPINHAGFGLQLPMEYSPQRVLERMLGPSQSTNPLTRYQGSALDFARAEYDALAPKLGKADRDKLDLHFGLVRQLEQRIEGLASAQCSAPSVPTDLATYDEGFDAMAELIGVAFSCDLARVVSFSLGDQPAETIGWNQESGDVHNDFAHEIYNNPTSALAMTDYVATHAAQIARLVSLLESIPDTDGRSVMDNTLIVWGAEMADGWHGYQHWCPVIIGGDWHFRTGRYLHWPHRTPVEILTPTGHVPTGGLPHQHLLVSIAQAMGLDRNHIGIDVTHSKQGDRIDCTGPLQGLV